MGPLGYDVPHLFAGGAPMLSKVDLHGIQISPNILPLMAITSLELTQNSFSSCDQFSQFLLAVPLLMDLTIWQHKTTWDYERGSHRMNA